MLIDNPWGLPQGDADSPLLIAEPRGGIPEVISTPDALNAMRAQLSASNHPVALDVERAQGFRYGSDPYLVQIRREDTGLFLIDSAALTDLSCLQEGLNGCWILHDASQDLPNLRSLGLTPPELFDTQVAARLVGLERFGLAAVCEQVLGLALLKDHQAANWSVRPLPQDWLRYAALDVELLTALRERLLESLDHLGRVSWAEEECAHILQLPPPAPKPDRWRSLPGLGKVSSRRALNVARELWETRDDIARELDIAPGRLVRNAGLVQAAQRPPRTKHHLMGIAEFRSPVARQYASQWLEAISRGLTAVDSDLPPLRRPVDTDAIPDPRHWGRVNPAGQALLQKIREAVARRAQQLEITQDILLEPRIQRACAWDFADRRPVAAEKLEDFLREQGARPWQMSEASPTLAKVLSRR